MKNKLTPTDSSDRNQLIKDATVMSIDPTMKNPILIETGMIEDLPPGVLAINNEPCEIASNFMKDNDWKKNFAKNFFQDMNWESKD